MKIFTRVQFLIVALCCWGILGYGQVTTIDFETAGDGYTPSTTFGTGITDVFNRTNINIGGNSSFYWAAEDITGSPTITLDQIDVAGSESFILTIDLLTPNTNDWDSSDEFTITYSLDGGASQNLLWVRTINANFNNPAAIDADFSGRGDNAAGSLLPALVDDEGAGVGVNFENFSSSLIPLSGNSTLDITISLAVLDANDEGIYFDNIMITETTSSVEPEPTNHPTNFIVATGTPPTSVIDMVWDDAIGAQLPAGYVIKANTTGTFTDPVDGTDPALDGDLSDGEALVKIPQGTEFYSFSGLEPSTQYYFKIWPYTNAGANIDFKTDGTPLEDNATTEAACGITALGSATIACDSNTSGDDNDFVMISLSYTGVDADAVLAIEAGGSSKSNTGDAPTAVTDGTISFAALEGNAWSVTITGGNCDLSQSGTVSSSECDPIPIIISRVADPADDTDGRFVEIKNVGASSQDISGWQVARYSPSLNTNNIDIGTLAPGETYIIGFTNFADAYGCTADETAGIIGGNGDDSYAILDENGDIVDIYGEAGVDGTGAPWDYTGSIAIRNADVTAASTVWIASEWTITSANISDIDACIIPDNNECINATVINCGDIFTNETTVGATDNGDATGCNYGRGVWYSFEGTNQNVTVVADGSNDFFDLGLSISTSDNCTTFNNIRCRNAFPSTGFERVTFFANSGTTYYFYIAYYGNTSNIVGEFDISVTCTDVDIAAGSDGVCDAVDNITSTGSGAWLNIVDASGDLAASVLDSENLGLLQTSVYINAGDVRQDGNNLPYLDRNISIEPATQPSGAVKVRLYLTTAEFNALAAADSDVSSISDLNITKFDGGCSNEFNGAGTVVQQSASGTLNAGYFVEVDITSFSNFFLHADLVALPVEITNFTAKALNNQTHLSFTTATEENNSHFLIQRSTDEGKTFQTIGQVDGKGDSASAVDYEFVDTKPAAGMNYYRLQQFDFDGTNEFFGPVAVRFRGEVADAPVIWPVPARDRLQIELPASDSDWRLEVFDLNGRRLLQQTTEEKGLNTFFDLNTLPAGSYFLRWNNGSQSGQERFLKV